MWLDNYPKNIHILFYRYPENMREIDLHNIKDIHDLLMYSWESDEIRYAWEYLRIIWIKKKLNLGYAFGVRKGVVTAYKIGSEEDWYDFKHDNY